MKRNYIIIAIILATGSFLFAQAPVGEPDASRNPDSAQQYLQDVTVSQFEDQGFWRGAIASDIGLISILTRNGAPLGKQELDKERLEKEAAVNAPIGQSVLGAKVRFYKRAITSFSITPARPIPIEGKCKTISAWVAGRNFNHVIRIILEDYFGKQHELTLGRLNFLGWKKLTVAIPPTLIQSEYHYTHLMGVKFVGFKVYCDLMETTGTFYIYFDDLSAVTDLYEIRGTKDNDDIMDDW